MPSIQSASFGFPSLDSGLGSTRAMSLDSVALLFQSILLEDRLTPLVRVWLARLQMPLVRHALAQPTLFGSESHPCMALVTHIVSCALGLEHHAAPADALEQEIHRLVVMVEKNAAGGYETCHQAHTEFRAFLARHRQSDEARQTEAGTVREEEKVDVFKVQYTVLLRQMLQELKVRQEVTEFLFKVWAEVLALASVRYGPEEPTTLLFKHTAIALVWATGARKTRRSRARVIKDVPGLLQTLRTGMDLLGLTEDEKNRHITTLSTPMMDAFLNKQLPHAASPAQINNAPERYMPQPRSVVRSKAARKSSFPGMDVIEDYPSSQGWHFWESAQAEQKDELKAVQVTDSTWSNPRGHRER